MKLLLKVFALFLLSVLAPGVKGSDSPWHSTETEENFVSFPQSVEDRLANEIELYNSESYPLPVLRIFQKYPEPEDQQKRLWPRLKSMNKRMHPYLWPHVQYHVEEGLEFGCRKPDPDSDVGLTLPITTSHCHRHCLRQGRYCLDEPDIHSNHRRGALKEIMRRLCMDTVYHAKDPRYFSYLEHFDAMECGGNPEGGFRNCSLTAMDLAGMKYSDISKCVAEDKYDKDIPHEAMNRNLRQLKKYREKHYELPYVTINDETIGVDKPLTTSTIFQEYCSFFPTVPEQPLACHACKGCDNIRDCLWRLRCDGREFDPMRLKPEVLSLTAPPKPNQQDAEETEAPTEPYVDNDTDNDVVSAQVMKEEQEGIDEDDNFESDFNEGNGGGIWIFLATLITVPSVTMGACYYLNLRRKQTLKRLRDMRSGKYSDGTFGVYRDDPDANYTVEDDSGISVPRLNNNDSANDNDDSMDKQHEEAFSDEIDDERETFVA